MFKYVAVFLMFLYGINSQIYRPGTCKSVSIQQNFVLEKFGGVWYEAEKYPDPLEAGGSCTHHDLTPVSDVKMLVRITLLLRPSGGIKVIEGDAVLTGRKDEARFVVTLHNGDEAIATPYWPLETDYDNYVVVWSCAQWNETTVAEFSYILTRDRHPSAELMQKAYSVYDRENVSRKDLQKVDQNNC